MGVRILARVVVPALMARLVLLTPAATSAAGGAGASSTPSLVPLVVVGPAVGARAGQPPTSAQCAAATGGAVKACFGPASIQAQYGFGPLYGRSIDGSGQTIVIFDSYGSPTIRQDLATFDATYGLPAPPSLSIIEPEGNVVLNYTGLPSPVDFHNKNVSNEIGWAYETSLDVEWAHALAPGASIDLVVIPVAETQGVQGIPNMQQAQQYALSHRLGTVWSNSWATTEQAFHTMASIRNLDGLYSQAAAQGVTAFFASGDSGVANTDKQGRLYPYPTVTYPSSSPNVVSVGGTEIPNPPPTIGSYQPEAAWNDCCGSGGGGYSSVFAEPGFQSGAAIPDPAGARGLPDVSMNAALVSAVLIYESFDPTTAPGWVIIGGTSEATPLWAATAAVMNQADGPLGFFAPRLYQVYENPSLYAEGFHDVTAGTNSWSGITGYAARPGWDPATGLGTPDASGLAAALAQTSP